MAKKVVIMDLSAILLAGIKGNKSRLWNVGAYPTGGLYNIFNRICAEVKKGSIVYIAADGAPYNKKSVYPQYKGDRPATRTLDKDIFKVQAIPVERYANEIGYKFIKEPGYEADDIIYSLAALYGNDPEYNVEIISSDKDLHSTQLFGDNITLISNTDRKKINGDPYQLWNKFLYGGKDNIPNLSREMKVQDFQIILDLVHSGYSAFGDSDGLDNLGLNEESKEMVRLNYYLAMPSFLSHTSVKQKLTSMQYNEQALVDLLTAFALNMSLKSLGKTYADANKNNVIRIQEDMYSNLSDEVVEYFMSKDQIYLNFVYETDQMTNTKVKNIIDQLKKRRE